MPPQSFAESLLPLADASTLSRNKLHSHFSPLVSWLATLWALEAGRMDTSLLPDEEFFVSTADFPDPPNAPPSVHSVDTASCDDSYASERSSPLIRPHKCGLTEKEFDYVVDSLLEYLEEAEFESGYEESEYYDPEDTEYGLPHDLWSPVSPLYLMNDSEDEDDISEVESLERGGLYDRASLSSVAAACLVPNHAELPDGDDGYPYQFKFEFEGEVNHDE